MTPDRVRRLIDAYGADPRKWPDREREEAAALLARDPDLAAHARDAAALDGLFQAVRADRQDAAAPAWLAQRILAQAPRPRRGWRDRLHQFRLAVAAGTSALLLQTAGALVVALAVGLWAGAAGFSPDALTPGALSGTTTGLPDGGTEIDYAFYGLADDAIEEWAHDG